MPAADRHGGVRGRPGQPGASLLRALWPEGRRSRLGARRRALARALKFDFTHGKLLLGHDWTLLDKWDKSQQYIPCIYLGLLSYYFLRR